MHHHHRMQHKSQWDGYTGVKNGIWPLLSFKWPKRSRALTPEHFFFCDLLFNLVRFLQGVKKGVQQYDDQKPRAKGQNQVKNWHENTIAH